MRERELAGLILLRESMPAIDGTWVLAVHEGHVHGYRKEAYDDYHTLTFHLDGAPLRRRAEAQRQATLSLPGRVSLQRCDERACWDSDSASRWAQFYLPVALLDDCASRHFGLDPACVQLDTATGIADRPLVQRLHQAVAAWQARPEGAGSRIDVWAWDIAVHWIARHSSVAATAPAAGRETLPAYKLRRVCDFIDVHLERSLPVASLAREVGLSAAHFARAFRRATGMPPHRYILARRAERARALIADGSRPLAHVAIDAGFANQAHLTSVFVASFGITPGTYRRHLAPAAWQSPLGEIRESYE